MRVTLALVAALVLSTAAQAEDPKPIEDGLYWVTDGKPAVVVSIEDEAAVPLAGPWKPEITKAQVISTTNRNDSYDAQIVCAYDAEFRDRVHVLVIGGVATLTHGGGWSGTKTMHINFELGSQARAKAVAKHFGVKSLDRRHPRQQLDVRFKQVGEWKGDDAHLVELVIENVGQKPVAFVQGGQNRGERDSQFSFVAMPADAMSGGLPDVGKSLNFGGISVARVLKPGEVHRQRVDLRKWFDMKPGMYFVIGTYQMSYLDPADPTDYLPIWESLVGAHCIVEKPAK